jgi:hypothetical protein
MEPENATRQWSGRRAIRAKAEGRFSEGAPGRNALQTIADSVAARVPVRAPDGRLDPVFRNSAELLHMHRDRNPSGWPTRPSAALLGSPGVIERVTTDVARKRKAFARTDGLSASMLASSGQSGGNQLPSNCDRRVDAGSQFGQDRVRVHHGIRLHLPQTLVETFRNLQRLTCFYRHKYGEQRVTWSASVLAQQGAYRSFTHTSAHDTVNIDKALD